MELKTYMVETWGCQMNVLDSQYLEGILRSRGLLPVQSASQADVAVLNTCSVREKAVHKVLSRLGELRVTRLESGRPRVVGLCGCVAEQEGARLLARSSMLTFVLGPGRIGQLGAALDAAGEGERVSVTGFETSRDVDTHLIARGSSVRQYVTVVHGCNQHCTFCIVPYTRGHELSRPLSDIVAEVEGLATTGVREITLLGQTVNAYRCPVTGAGFADLLAAVDGVAGSFRVQFLTSHPKYFTDKMIEALSRLSKVGRYLHVPFQAGSDGVLKRMHRSYTRGEYLALVDRLRRSVPDLTLSTDVIVGFPGESDADFEQTLSLIDDVRFGQLYGFIYSPRPRTPAARYGERVPANVARERLERVFALQGAVQLELNQAMIGRTTEVLVDGPAKRGAGVWQGRGDDNRVVTFAAWDGIHEGLLTRIDISGATAHGLLGARSAAPTAPSLPVPA